MQSAEQERSHSGPVYGPSGGVKVFELSGLSAPGEKDRL